MTEIFYHPNRKTDSWLTVLADGRINHRITRGRDPVEGGDLDIIIPLDDACLRWPLYADDIKKAVAGALVASPVVSP